jgi:hypothetical protein
LSLTVCTSTEIFIKLIILCGAKNIKKIKITAKNRRPPEIFITQRYQSNNQKTEFFPLFIRRSACKMPPAGAQNGDNPTAGERRCTKGGKKASPAFADRLMAVPIND